MSDSAVVPREVTQQRLNRGYALIAGYRRDQHYSVADLLEARALDAAARPFIVFEGHSVSFGEMNALANRIAHAALAAGLKSGDVVLQIDGVDVEDMQGLNYRIATHRPGDVVRARVESSRQMREVSLIVSVPPEVPPRQLTTIAGHNPLTGARVENLSPAVATDLQLDFSARGVVIVSTTANTPSGSYGFQPGDIVRSINGADIRSVGELQRVLESANGRWDLVVDRGKQKFSFSVSG